MTDPGAPRIADYLEHILQAIRRIYRYTARHPNVPWAVAYEMRNVLAHGYFKIDLEVVWKTIETDLPKLEKANYDSPGRFNSRIGQPQPAASLSPHHLKASLWKNILKISNDRLFSMHLTRLATTKPRQRSCRALAFAPCATG